MTAKWPRDESVPRLKLPKTPDMMGVSTKDPPMRSSFIFRRLDFTPLLLSVVVNARSALARSPSRQPLMRRQRRRRRWWWHRCSGGGSQSPVSGCRPSPTALSNQSRPKSGSTDRDYWVELFALPMHNYSLINQNYN